MNIYQENGYEDREDYLQGLAEEYEFDFETVLALADSLGPQEDFDMLVTYIEQYGDW